MKSQGSNFPELCPSSPDSTCPKIHTLYSQNQQFQSTKERWSIAGQAKELDRACIPRPVIFVLVITCKGEQILLGMPCHCECWSLTMNLCYLFPWNEKFREKVINKKFFSKSNTQTNHLYIHFTIYVVMKVPFSASILQIGSTKFALHPWCM